MMKIVLDANNNVVAFGPDTKHYQPFVKDGERIVTMSDDEANQLLNPAPVLEEVIAKSLLQIDADTDAIYCDRHDYDVV